MHEDPNAAVVGTPGYFERHSRPKTPADLQQHRCINYRLIGGGVLADYCAPIPAAASTTPAARSPPRCAP